MANNLTNYAESALLKHILGIASFAMPTGAYLALFTADPTETGSLVAEVTGGSYARQAITWGAEANGTVTNSADIAFPAATAAWGTITHVAIMDASVAGNALYVGALTASKNVANTDQFKVLAGQLSVSLD